MQFAAKFKQESSTVFKQAGIAARFSRAIFVAEGFGTAVIDAVFVGG
jgi:hypothetical protein